MSAETGKTQQGQSWWRGAVVYQIYPRSFADSTGDGYGDLGGIRAKLDYIASLGVDAVWLSPITPSPNRDWGYDVADYTGVHPDFGTMDQFSDLLSAAHDRGLKVILDQVLSHTSDEHPWFADSVRGGERRDWYVWADPRADGTAPNNWLSVFGGPAWSYHAARRQYYHHKFYREQPKLNLHNRDCRDAVLDVLRFWLDLGVDGFRLDVANTYLHDPSLTDNPPVPEAERTNFHWAMTARMQRPIHDANREENITVLEEIRRLTDRYDDRWVFGEFSEEPRLLPLFADPERGLHSGYTFDFLDATRLDADLVRRFYGQMGDGDVWPCVTLSNHDVPRPVTRLGRIAAGVPGEDALARFGLALMLCLRGSVLLYQGEELGLEEGDIPNREQIRDPIGDLFYPYFKGRDGCRVPMPWRDDAAHWGFTSGTPWLPAAPAHGARAPNAQEAAQDSVLHATRAMIAARQASAILRDGGLTVLDAPDPVIAFLRGAGQEALLFTGNPTPDPVSWVPGRRLGDPIQAFCQSADHRDGAVHLGPWGVWVGRAG